jgi:hypothetical protein
MNIYIPPNKEENEEKIIEIIDQIINETECCLIYGGDFNLRKIK